MKTYYINKKDDHWQFKKEGAERATFVAETQKEVEKFSREFSKDKNGISVRLQGKDGRFREESTYQRENDPIKSKG